PLRDPARLAMTEGTWPRPASRDRWAGWSRRPCAATEACITQGAGSYGRGISQRLGHADHNITLSIYSHALPADARAAAKIWNDSMADVIATARRATRTPSGTLGPAKRTGTK
ncbi:MAG TPA: hypothetical protein VLN48_13990, partial [Bryobacteraceae bacterium]|nr:hypothetical protein [Bryobacteraceae bacterium]